jgi:hypothetical protein
VYVYDGVVVAQLVEALCYKSEGQGSIPDGVTRIFIDIILPAALWPQGWLSLKHKCVPGG